MTRASTLTRLLDATAELVFVHGDPRTPVDEILERAGVSPATMYRAYDSKEALIAAALDRRHLQWLESWDRAVARASDDRARLLAIFDALEEFRAGGSGARWCAFLGTAAEYVDPPPVLAAAVRQDSESMRDRLHQHGEPLVGPRAADLADALVLVVTGHLAMRLRPGARATTAAARAVAEVLLDHPERLRPAGPRRAG